MKPRISFVIPAYNAKLTLQRCIDSILACPISSEIIIVDDGSGDHTNDFIKTNYGHERKIVYIFKQNGGVSSARNVGILKASAKYISFVDADDEIVADGFEKLFALINNYNLDWIEGNYISVWKNKEKKYNIDYNFLKAVKSNMNFREVLELYSLGYVWGKIYKRDILLENNLFFNEKMTYAEDRYFNLKYALYVNSIGKSFLMSYRYYLDRNTLSRRYCPNYIESMDLIKKATRAYCDRLHINYSDSMEFEIFVGSIRNEFRRKDISIKNKYQYIQKRIKDVGQLKNIEIKRRQDIVVLKILETNSVLLVFLFFSLLNRYKG